MFSTPGPAASILSYSLLSNNIDRLFHIGTSADHSDDEIVWGRSDDGAASPSSRSSFSDTYVTGPSNGSGFVVLSYPPLPHMPTLDPRPLTPVRNQMRSIKGPQLYTPTTSSSKEALSAQMAAMTLSSKAKIGRRRKGKKAKKDKTDGAQKGESVSPSGRKKQGGKAKKVKSKAVDNSAAPDQPYPSPAPSPATVNTRKTSSKPKAPISGKAKCTGKSVALVGLGSRPIVDDISDRLSVVSQDKESVGTSTLYDEASTFISR